MAEVVGQVGVADGPVVVAASVDLAAAAVAVAVPAADGKNEFV